MYPSMHPGYTPWADTPPEQTRPPRVDTPWADTLLPSVCWDTPPGRHPPAQCMLGYTPPGQIVLPGQTPPCPVYAGIHTPPWKDTPPHPSQTATAVDAPHPTGMRSCLLTVTVVV